MVGVTFILPWSGLTFISHDSYFHVYRDLISNTRCPRLLNIEARFVRAFVTSPELLVVILTYRDTIIEQSFDHSLLCITAKSDIYFESVFC